jgi:hypothetical protein
MTREATIEKMVRFICGSVEIDRCSERLAPNAIASGPARLMDRLKGHKTVVFAIFHVTESGSACERNHQQNRAS